MRHNYFIILNMNPTGFFFAKILAELILRLYDHSVRVIWSFSKVESSASERNKIQLGTENKLRLYKLKSFVLCQHIECF